MGSIPTCYTKSMSTATSRFYRWIKLELSSTDATTIIAMCKHCQAKSKLEAELSEKLLEQVKKFETLHSMCKVAGKNQWIS